VRLGSNSNPLICIPLADGAAEQMIELPGHGVFSGVQIVQLNDNGSIPANEGIDVTD
jgi:hypothetical protein